MQANRKRVTTRQQGGTKYVFAGTRDQDEGMPTKVCPRCGEMLFADMEVCYGCLYDFTKDARGRRTLSAGSDRRESGRVSSIAASAPARARARDPLDVVELDEIDEEVEDEVGDEGEGEVSATPRHGRRAGESADDTVDFGSLRVQEEVAAAKDPAYVIIVRGQDMQVRVPLTRAGLTVGRGESNGIVLRSRAVSREHLRLTPLDGKVLVEDCGATNPARIGDKPLEDSAVLSAGDVVEVCGATLKIEGATLA